MNDTAPARLLSVLGTRGLVELDGAEVPVSTLLVPYAVAGDWVLVHAGFAIQQLGSEDGATTVPAIEEFSAGHRPHPRATENRDDTN